MSPYSRPAKVLMYLVASMSVATGLLLWIEHLVVPAGAPAPAAVTKTPLLKALQTNSPIAQGSWDEIVISYRDRVPGDLKMALAVPGRQLPYHFIIQTNGEVHALPMWQQQQTKLSEMEVGSRAIRVCFAGQPESTAVSADQWVALVSLLQQLQTRCHLSSKSVRLDPQSDPQFRPNIPDQAYRLREMLLAAEIID